MINPSDYSCDKCARECSQHCKYCLHTAYKPPTKFKKKKTGCETPEYKHPSQAPNPNYTPPATVAKPKPPNTGSSVQKPCKYKTPCGWCDKWEKRCDCKIPDPPVINQYDSDLDDIKSGCGLVFTDLHSTTSSGIRKW